MPSEDALSSAIVKAMRADREAVLAETSHKRMPDWFKSLLPWVLGTLVAGVVATAGEFVRFGTFQRDFHQVQEDQRQDREDLKQLQQDSASNQKAIREAIEQGNRNLSAFAATLPTDYVPRKELVDREAMRVQMESDRDKRFDKMQNDLDALLRRR